MRAVGFTEFGGPEVLHVLELDEPHAGPGQVRIKVSAVDVNPSDTAGREGGYVALMQRINPDYQVPPPPYVVGWDVAGVVDEIGPATATELSVGDRVVATANAVIMQGAYVEYLAANVESVAASPISVDDIAACTLPMNGLTARMGLDQLALPAGSTVAVTGAAGAVGGFTVQLAKAGGLRVIADASTADENLVRELGADVVVRRGPDVAKRIREVAPDGVDAVVDAAVLDDAILDAVRDGGAVVSLRSYSGPKERGITWHPIFVTKYLTDPEKLSTLCRQVDTGELTLRVAEALPLEQAAEAHRRLEAGGVRGRLVLTL